MITLKDLNSEIDAAIEICKKASVAEDRLLATIVGIVEVSTGVNVLGLLDQGFKLSMVTDRPLNL